MSHTRSFASFQIMLLYFASLSFDKILAHKNEFETKVRIMLFQKQTTVPKVLLTLGNMYSLNPSLESYLRALEPFLGGLIKNASPDHLLSMPELFINLPPQFCAKEMREHVIEILQQQGKTHRWDKIERQWRSIIKYMPPCASETPSESERELLSLLLSKALNAKDDDSLIRLFTIFPQWLTMTVASYQDRMYPFIVCLADVLGQRVLRFPDQEKELFSHIIAITKEYYSTSYPFDGKQSNLQTCAWRLNPIDADQAKKNPVFLGWMKYLTEQLRNEPIRLINGSMPAQVNQPKEESTEQFERRIKTLLGLLALPSQTMTAQRKIQQVKQTLSIHPERQNCILNAVAKNLLPLWDEDQDTVLNFLSEHAAVVGLLPLADLVDKVRVLPLGESFVKLRQLLHAHISEDNTLFWTVFDALYEEKLLVKKASDIERNRLEEEKQAKFSWEQEMERKQKQWEKEKQALIAEHARQMKEKDKEIAASTKQLAQWEKRYRKMEQDKKVVGKEAAVQTQRMRTHNQGTMANYPMAPQSKEIGVVTEQPVLTESGTITPRRHQVTRFAQTQPRPDSNDSEVQTDAFLTDMPVSHAPEEEGQRTVHNPYPAWEEASFDATQTEGEPSVYRYAPQREWGYGYTPQANPYWHQTSHPTCTTCNLCQITSLCQQILTHCSQNSFTQAY